MGIIGGFLIMASLTMSPNVVDNMAIYCKFNSNFASKSNNNYINYSYYYCARIFEQTSTKLYNLYKLILYAKIIWNYAQVLQKDQNAVLLCKSCKIIILRINF